MNNFIKVEDNLYQGGMPRSTNGGWGLIATNPKNWAILSLDITGICDTDELGLNIIHLKMPIMDGVFPGLSWLETAVEAIELFVRNGRTVYIHCYAGISRSAMVAAAYLMKKHKWEVDTAMNKLAEVNSAIDPCPSFITGLKQWHSSHFGSKGARDWDWNDV